MNDEEKAVLAANDAFYRAFEKKDIDKMTALWSQGINTACIHPGRSALRGSDKIRKSWEMIFKNTAYIEIDTEIITTEISGNLAYVLLIEKVLQVTPGRKMKAESMATNIFERMGGNWYLIHHHGSPIMS